MLRLDPEAKLPGRGTGEGYTLYSLQTLKINGTRALVKTGLAIQIPSGSVGLIKSGVALSFNYGLEVGAGIITEGTFPGHVKVMLHNHSRKIISIPKHCPVAQLLIIPMLTPEVVEVHAAAVEP